MSDLPAQQQQQKQQQQQVDVKQPSSPPLPEQIPLHPLKLLGQTVDRRLDHDAQHELDQAFQDRDAADAIARHHVDALKGELVDATPLGALSIHRLNLLVTLLQARNAPKAADKLDQFLFKEEWYSRLQWQRIVGSGDHRLFRLLDLLNEVPRGSGEANDLSHRRAVATRTQLRDFNQFTMSGEHQALLDKWGAIVRSELYELRLRLQPPGGRFSWRAMYTSEILPSKRQKTSQSSSSSSSSSSSRADSASGASVDTAAMGDVADADALFLLSSVLDLLRHHAPREYDWRIQSGSSRRLRNAALAFGSNKSLQSLAERLLFAKINSQLADHRYGVPERLSYDGWSEIRVRSFANKLVAKVWKADDRQTFESLMMSIPEELYRSLPQATLGAASFSAIRIDATQGEPRKKEETARFAVIWAPALHPLAPFLAGEHFVQLASELLSVKPRIVSEAVAGKSARAADGSSSSESEVDTESDQESEGAGSAATRKKHAERKKKEEEEHKPYGLSSEEFRKLLSQAIIRCGCNGQFLEVERLLNSDKDAQALDALFALRMTEWNLQRATNTVIGGWDGGGALRSTILAPVYLPPSVDAGPSEKWTLHLVEIDPQALTDLRHYLGGASSDPLHWFNFQHANYCEPETDTTKNPEPCFVNAKRISAFSKWWKSITQQPTPKFRGDDLNELVLFQRFLRLTRSRHCDGAGGGVKTFCSCAKRHSNEDEKETEDDDNNGLLYCPPRRLAAAAPPPSAQTVFRPLERALAVQVAVSAAVPMPLPVALSLSGEKRKPESAPAHPTSLPLNPSSPISSSSSPSSTAENSMLVFDQEL